MSDDITALLQHDIGILSKTAGKLLGRLTAGGFPSASRYQTLVREIQEVRTLWISHVEMSSNVFPAVLSHSRHIARFLHQFVSDQSEVRRQLDGLASVGWPRSFETGIESMRLRATGTLTLMLRQLETERSTVLPLVRRQLAADAYRTQHAETRWVSAKPA